MRIYVSHSRSFDFQKDLYDPLKNANLPVEFIFPHEKSNSQTDSKELFENHECDYVLAEVSFPSTGQGIELGWANIFNIPVICFYKKDSKPSNSLKVITDKIIEYNDMKELVVKLSNRLKLNYA